ncbi:MULTISPECIES: carbohydrate-binding protein [unclassified Bradyrhizobium]|uniref:carbohydrate-binding protein n=1 Tax=unclassified Bradyrhizobium TaxID=2631580 RepID=UPI001FF9011B|nr:MULTISPECIES: carbohydrate-binding protein [unclassified Bradyrhizobium]
MTALSSYSTGTVAVSADGTTVTGTSTLWLNTGNVKPGDRFQAGHFEAIVTDVVDDTHLTITPWPGSTLSGASYVVWKVSQQRIVGETYAADVAKAVAAWNTSGFYVFVDANATAPDPSLGYDGQYALQPTTGKTWASLGGVWTYLGIYKAFQLKGAWSGATAYTVGDVVSLSGSSYVCVLDHTNHTPPNVTYWQLLASIGATGNTGPTGASYGGTSTTSLAIGTGSKAFTTQAGLAYQNGARVRATATAGAAGWLEGVATYSGTTLTVTSDKISGTGTGTAWNFNVTGEPGAGDVTGPASSTSGNLATYNGTTGKIIQDGAAAISTDGTFASNSDAKVPTEKAVKTYVDTAGGAWTVTNPTVTASSGTFTTVTCQLRYKLIGKTAVFTATVTMTNAGTASGNILFNLPFTPIVAHAGGGKEILSLGHQCNWQTSSSQMIIAKYDNTSVIATGRGVVITGTIEVV